MYGVELSGLVRRAVMRDGLSNRDLSPLAPSLIRRVLVLHSASLVGGYTRAPGAEPSKISSARRASVDVSPFGAACGLVVLQTLSMKAAKSAATSSIVSYSVT